ncbi:hypothetical protein PR002_g22656 [Phytophthora rubi]|uniref:Uncharacterized protein n=1 Tax=Phytophthora rubi TaxID=129364 RepID=A0A6A3ITP9_9STRA|nr:hypothetical protein PR002_g22656 [Phytophthora rubi]
MFISPSRGIQVPSSFLFGSLAVALLVLIAGIHARPPCALVNVAANITDPVCFVGIKSPYSPSRATTDTCIGVTARSASFILPAMRTAAILAPPLPSRVRNGITTARSPSRYLTSFLSKSMVAPFALIKSTPNKNSLVHPATTHASTITFSSNTLRNSKRQTPTTSSRNPPIPST